MGNKILGLDLGVASIGWALIEVDETTNKILGTGCRIVPLSREDKDEFSQGLSITKNQKRTLKRTQRKGYDRYQLRRKALTKTLIEKGMFDPALFNLSPLELWGLRAKACGNLDKSDQKQDDAKVSLKEFGRILYHINQKRGYKSSRSDSSSSKEETEYVAAIQERHKELKTGNITIGQKFFAELANNPDYRTKQQVYPREAYIEEFNAIVGQQQKHYPEILTDELVTRLRDTIIFHQRPLKSQKGKVGHCDFEAFETKSVDGKLVFVGPKVAHRSSPIFQTCKLWESINSIRLKNKSGQDFNISIEKKQELFDYLDNHDQLTSAKLLDILGLKKNEGWYTNKQIERGIQGNSLKALMRKHLGEDSNLLRFTTPVSDSGEEVYLPDRETGEIRHSSTRKWISPSIEQEPLYQLWHTIYSINDVKECYDALISRFNLPPDTARSLANLDLSRLGYGNKSTKAIRKILPYLMEGHVYSDACYLAGYNHSHSLTKEENLSRALKQALPLLPKNSLRQPIVEKILNQMINVVNAIIDKYGHPHEIRVELARELKQSRDERNDAFKELRKRERENQNIASRLTQEYGIRATRRNIIKWRLYHEINNNESKVNATCIYCGKTFGITESLLGHSVDVEHIIPKSLLFDDSQANKTLSHRSCNEEKGQRTAYDYMHSKSEEEFNQYLERVSDLYKQRLISKNKRDKLLMPKDKIPKDFIDRQLRESQYIARKSREILLQVCHNVWSTSGKVTEYLRRIWGWDDALMNLQMPKYKALGLTEIIETETRDGQIHKHEVIQNWSKRDDQRHHAIDALVVACTQQGFIHRINNLSKDGNRDEMYASLKEKTGSGSLLEKYLVSKRPFSTAEVESVAENILISYKQGKKVATNGRRTIKVNGKKVTAQSGILVPRGPLSEEYIYGKIQLAEKNLPVKYLFENPDLIVSPVIRNKVIHRIKAHGGDVKKALNSLKKEPIYTDKSNTAVLLSGTCYKPQYVKKYPITEVNTKNLKDVVDFGVRKAIEEHLARFGNDEKLAYREPVYWNNGKKSQIRSVRMRTGLASVEAIRKDENGNGIAFVKPGNNHHIAVYENNDGKVMLLGCTFWHAVDRKRFGLPVIIRDTKKVWNMILSASAEYPQEFLTKLPSEKWRFLESFQQNEMFLLGIDSDVQYPASPHLLSPYLYRVQKLSIGQDGSLDLVFRHHLETQLIDSEQSKQMKRYFRIKSWSALSAFSPKKVRIDCIGQLHV